MPNSDKLFKDMIEFCNSLFKNNFTVKLFLRNILSRKINVQRYFKVSIVQNILMI